MMVTGGVILALVIVLGLSAWEVWADLQDARRAMDALQATIDRQEYVIAELRRRIGELNRESETHD